MGLTPASDRAMNPARISPTATGSQIAHAVSTVDQAIQELQQKNANPATIAMLERVGAAIQDGSISPMAVYLPNLNLLLNPPSSPAMAVAPTYGQTPAPMGLGDFGLGGASGVTKPYALNTSAVRGNVTLTSYNATAGSYYEDSSPLYQNATPANAPGSPYDSGIQLNTVLANVTFPQSYTDPLGSGVFWTQNVLQFTGGQMRFVDNIWNWSESGSVLYNHTLYSFKGTLVNGSFYFDYSKPIPVSFPMSVQLYNNASVNQTTGRDVLTFGYHVTEGAKSYAATYDTIVFNSPVNSTKHLTPGFRVNGFAATPFGALFDSELVFGGPGAGSNAVVTNASGQLALAYLEGTNWMAPKSAYDYGTDTGETAVGLAATWSGTTVNLTQGPSLLYGLWGTPDPAGSGALRFVGHLTPIYGFAFIGEYYAGTNDYQAYAPSNALGVVSTVLPPTLPTPFTAYGLVAYADEYAPLALTTFSTSQTNFAITMTKTAGWMDAPLYMNGEAQATALVSNITGVTTSPYTFKNLELDLDNLTYGLLFNLVNDYGYTSFNLVYATGLTSPIVVNNVNQGPNFLGGTYYYLPGYGYIDRPNGSQQYVDYGGVGDTFENLYLPGYYLGGGPAGGAISLWDTSKVTVINVTAVDGSQGVWASTTQTTTVKNSVAVDAVAFSDIASTGAVGFNITGEIDATAVVDVGGTGGTFTYVNATIDSYGVYGYWANGTTANDVRANYDATGIDLENGAGLTSTQIWANASSEGLFVYNVTKVAVSDGSAGNSSTLAYVENGSADTFSTIAANDSDGVYFTGDFTTATVTGLTAVDDAYGGVVEHATGVTFTTVAANDSLGVLVVGTPAADVSITGLTAAAYAVGASVNDSSGVTISTVSAENYSGGVYLGEGTFGVTVTGVTVSLHSYGVEAYYATQITIDKISASGASLGAWLRYTMGVSVSNVTITNLTTAVWAYDTSVTTIMDVTATNATLTTFEHSGPCRLSCEAIDSEYNSELRISGVTATTYAAAIWDYDSRGIQISAVTANDGEYAIVLNDTEYSYLSGIQAAHNWQGIALNDAYDNTITGSTFTDSTSYGVALADGADGNTIYGNQFIANNGATSTYSAAHIQASSGEVNWFDINTNLGCIGNYWSDWQNTAANGTLGPYVISGSTSDYCPTHLVTAPSSTASGYSVLAVAIGLVGAFLVVVAVLALRHRAPRKAPPQQWTAPPAGSTGSAPPGASESNWSEGPPSKPPAA